MVIIIYLSDVDMVSELERENEQIIITEEQT
jgi:hypothetical protein